MRWIAFNIIPILLIILTGGMIYLNKEGWGWPLFIAALLGVYPDTQKEDKKEKNE